MPSFVRRLIPFSLFERASTAVVCVHILYVLSECFVLPIARLRILITTRTLITFRHLTSSFFSSNFCVLLLFTVYSTLRKSGVARAKEHSGGEATQFYPNVLLPNLSIV